MKLSKTLFFAAAAFAGTLVSAQAITILQGETKLSSEISGREFSVVCAGNGNLVVDSDRVRILNTSFGGHGDALLFAPHGRNITYNSLLPRDLQDFLRMRGSAAVRFDDDDEGGCSWATPNSQYWRSGTLEIKSGNIAYVLGSINSWRDYGNANGYVFNNEELTRGMDGVTEVLMETGSVLDISECRISAPINNVVIQYLHNIKSVDNASGTTLATSSSTANAQRYFVNIHIDDIDEGGSLGVITGSANILKTGAGNFTLTSESTNFKSNGNTWSANVFVAGGSLTLAAPEQTAERADYDPLGVLKDYCRENGAEYNFGKTVYNANSVNLAGTDGVQASGYNSAVKTGTVSEDQKKYNYTAYVGELVAAPEASSLVIQNNQVIKNFQALFANGVGGTDDTLSIESAVNAARRKSNLNPIVAGTGKGSLLGIEAGSVLAVNQETGRGGVYKGSIVGVGADGNATSNETGGTFVKYGKGDLALILEGANFEKLAVLEGRLIVNIRTLNIGGEGTDVDIDVGKGAVLTVIENETTTLNKKMEFDEDSDLEFATYAYISTEGGQVDVSDDRAPGTIEIAVAQDKVEGNVIVREGITLKPTAENAFSKAKSILLIGSSGVVDAEVVKAADHISVLDFGNQNQTINNLIGDKNSRIDTGTSSCITINIEKGINDEERYYDGQIDLSAVSDGKYGSFAGGIRGYGNIVKEGAGTLSLSGSGSGLTNYGALVVKEGDIAGTAGTLANASALILTGGVQAEFSGDQRFVAIYGAAEKTIDSENAAEVVTERTKIDLSVKNEDGQVVRVGNLTLGETGSRRSELSDSVNMVPATVFLSLTDRKIYENAGDAVSAFKPFFDLIGDSDQDLTVALEKFAMRGTLSAADQEKIREFFGDDSISTLSNLTETHIVTAYLKLLDCGVDSAYKGDIVAGTISKINGNTQSLLGKIETNAVSIEGGELVIAGDSISGETAESAVIDIARGAKLSVVVNDGVSERAVEIAGEGDFSVSSNVDLDLTDKFKNTTTGKITLAGTAENVNFTMTLRNNIPGVLAEQGDIDVTDANLVLKQGEGDVTWGNKLTVGGDLTKTGVSSLTLVSNDSNVDGTVFVEEGALILKDWNNAGTTAFHGITIANGAILLTEFSADAVFDGKLAGKGNLIKTGAGTLSMTGAAAVPGFSGGITVKEGVLKISTENYFGAETVVCVDSGATLELLKSQTVAGIDPSSSVSGGGEIKLGQDVNLTLVADSKRVVMDKTSGRYEAVIPELDGSLSGTLTGELGSKITIAGTGAFDFGAMSVDADVAVDIVSGQLVMDANLANRTDILTNSAGELVYRVNEEMNVSNADVPSSFGKIGEGLLKLTSAQTTGKTISLYEGEILVNGNNAFDFSSLKLAAGTTFTVNYSSGTAKLDKIEGSGTFVIDNSNGTAIFPLTLSAEMMLPTSGERYFNGTLEFRKMAITVDSALTMTALELDDASSLTVNANLTLKQSADSVIAGTVFISDSAQIVVNSSKNENGDFYKLAIGNIEDGSYGDIVVKNGAVQLKNNEEWDGRLVVEEKADLYFEVITNESKWTAANVDLSNAASVRLIKTGAGTLSLNGAGTGNDDPFKNIIMPAARASAAVQPHASTTTSSSLPITIGADDGRLVLTNIDSFGNNVSLTTLGSGILELSGAQTLDRNISGDGRVEKTGNNTLVVSHGQTFTGTMTLTQGTTKFEPGVSLATEQLIVKTGAKTQGTIRLTNASSASVLKTESGSTITLADGAKIVYAGTLDLGDIEGKIEFVGNGSAGSAVVFESTAESPQTFDDNELRGLLSDITLRQMGGADKFMLSSSAGTVSIYSFGGDFVSKANSHDGLGDFAKLLDGMLPHASAIENDIDPLVAGILKAGGDISVMIENLSTLSYSSMVAMSWRGHDNDIGQFRDRATARRFETVNEYADAGWQFWAVGQGTFVSNGNGSKSAVYDFNTYGVLIGADTKSGDYSTAGVAFGCDYGYADIHNNGGKIKSNDYRFSVYGSSLVGDCSWFVDYGATAAASAYDIDRKTALGDAKSKPEGFSLGAYGFAGRGFLVFVDREERLVLTPYAGLSAYYTTIGGEKESGGPGLDVDRINALSLRATAGASLDWVFPCGDFDARVGVDASFSHEFGDSDVDIDTRYNGEKCTVKSAGVSENTFSIGPSFSLTVGPHTSVRLSYHAEFGTNENISHNANLGFRHSF